MSDRNYKLNDDINVGTKRCKFSSITVSTKIPGSSQPNESSQLFIQEGMQGWNGASEPTFLVENEPLKKERNLFYMGHF